MVTAVLDADFLSAFLKIESLPRVRDYFRVENLHLPTAVFQEVAVTSLAPQLTSLDWLAVRSVAHEALSKAASAGGHDFAELGEGERQAIALALQQDCVLLTNDKKALRCAQVLAIRAVNIPVFLLMYRGTGHEGAAQQVREMVLALEQKDHFGFTQEVRQRLLAPPDDRAL